MGRKILNGHSIQVIRGPYISVIPVAKLGNGIKRWFNMIHRLHIIAEVLCPKINRYSDINFCADCMYYQDIEDGTAILCKYEDVMQ